MLNAKGALGGRRPAARRSRAKDKGNPLAVVYPEDGALLMVSPSGMSKNAPAPNAAKLFMEFLLDREAAEIMVKSHRSVNKRVKPLPGSKPLRDQDVRPTTKRSTRASRK